MAKARSTETDPSTAEHKVAESAPGGYTYGDPVPQNKLVDPPPTPRPYAQALTEEHRAALGEDAPKGEAGAQESTQG